MRRATVALLAAAVVACGALGAAPEQASSLTARLRTARNAVLEDPGSGRLYPQAAALLQAARRMPDRIQLRLPPVPAVPEPDVAEAQQVEPVPTPQPAGASRERWVAVASGPVVEQERLAYACFLAGDYGTAATLYGRLNEKEPDNVHFLLMLFLSVRNNGEAERAAELRKILAAKEDIHDWAEWVESMTRLGTTPEEETP